MPLSGVTTLAATAVRVSIVSRSILERQRQLGLFNNYVEWLLCSIAPSLL